MGPLNPFLPKFQTPRAAKNSWLCSGHSRASQSLCPWQACESRRLNMPCVKLYKPGNIALAAPAYETLGELRRRPARGVTNTKRDLGICQDCHAPARFLHLAAWRFAMPLLQMRTCEYTSLHKKNTGKDAAEDGHVPHEPNSSGSPSSSERKSSQKMFSADFRHIAQPAMFRALHEALKKC